MVVVASNTRPTHKGVKHANANNTRRANLSPVTCIVSSVMKRTHKVARHAVVSLDPIAPRAKITVRSVIAMIPPAMRVAMRLPVSLLVATSIARTASKRTQMVARPANVLKRHVAKKMKTANWTSFAKI